MGGKYAIQFGLMSAAATAAAIFSARDWGLRAGLFWTATALAIVAVAYATNRPGLMMKRPNGSRPAWAWVVLGPYFLLAGLSLWLYRRSTRRRIAVAEVRPGVWFARRLTVKELRHAGVKWSAVLDLAAEFPRVSVRDAQYRSLPVLDGTVPTQRQLRDAVD